MVTRVLSVQWARAVKLIDKAATIVVLVVGLVRLNEALVQVSNVGCVDEEARTQGMIVLVEDASDGREHIPVHFRITPEKCGGHASANLLDDPDTMEL